MACYSSLHGIILIQIHGTNLKIMLCRWKTSMICMMAQVWRFGEDLHIIYKKISAKLTLNLAAKISFTNLLKAQTYSSEDIITLFELKANNVKRPGFLHIRAAECFRPALKCSIKESFENEEDKFLAFVRIWNTLNLTPKRSFLKYHKVWRVGRLQK